MKYLAIYTIFHKCLWSPIKLAVLVNLSIFCSYI